MSMKGFVLVSLPWANRCMLEAVNEAGAQVPFPFEYMVESKLAFQKHTHIGNLRGSAVPFNVEHV